MQKRATDRQGVARQNPNPEGMREEEDGVGEGGCGKPGRMRRRRDHFSLSLGCRSVAQTFGDPLPRGKISFNVRAGLPRNGEEEVKPGSSPARALLTCSVRLHSDRAWVPGKMIRPIRGSSHICPTVRWWSKAQLALMRGQMLLLSPDPWKAS